MHTDEVDQLLQASDPARDLTADERRLAAEMVEQSRPVTKRQRYARPIAVAAIAAVALGGGGMAAAAATGLWEGWAQDDALAIVHYTLPSGASCEWRIGNVQGAPDEVEQVIGEALAGVELDHADVAEGVSSLGISGDPLTDDFTYYLGISGAIELRIDAALAAHGLDGGWERMEEQGVCE
jgi:hypothetical protein